MSNFNSNTNSQSFLSERERRIQENKDSYEASFNDCSYDNEAAVYVSSIRGSINSDYDYGFDSF